MEWFYQEEPVELHSGIEALNTHVFSKYNTVLSNLIPKIQPYHKLNKTFKFTIPRTQNTQGNHEDSNRVVMGLLGKGLEGNKCFGICGAKSQRLKERSSTPKYINPTIQTNTYERYEQIPLVGSKREKVLSHSKQHLCRILFIAHFLFFFLFCLFFLFCFFFSLHI